MVKLTSTFSQLNPIKVLVIGDLMLDIYTIGKVRRISPEAPVAILHVHKEERRPGGAGNVVLNLLSLGAEVVTVGRVGNDWAGQSLSKTLQDEKVDISSLLVQDNYQTPVKNRVVAENQQIVRIDHEDITPLPEPLEQFIIDSLPQLLKDVKVVAISDYGKGFLTPTLLSALIMHAKTLSILLIADPKGDDFSKYHGVTVIKPNLAEAYRAANLPPQASLEMVAKKILEMTQSEKLMITRSEAGISLFDVGGGRQDFPVDPRQIKDVTGAGDTVLAMLTCALANGLSYAQAAQLCNVAAGIAIEHFGCARIKLSDLANRLLEIDVSNKVFDEEHLFALQEALKGRRLILLALSQIGALDQHLFKAIRQLSEQQSTLLIYLDDLEPEPEFIEMLSSLKEVDFIVLHLDSLKKLCEKITPAESYVFERKSLKKLVHFSTLLNTL